jgi:hypothetical protein
LGNATAVTNYESIFLFAIDSRENHVNVRTGENEPPVKRLSLNLLAQDVLERDSVRRELGDTLAELLNRHLVLVEVETEVSLVVNVRLLLQVERVSLGSIELLGDCILGVIELLEQVGLKMSAQRNQMKD